MVPETPGTTAIEVHEPISELVLCDIPLVDLKLPERGSFELKLGRSRATYRMLSHTRSTLAPKYDLYTPAIVH